MLCVLTLLLSSSALAQNENRVTTYEMRWSPDGRWIGVGSTDGIWIFDLEDTGAEPYHYAEGVEVYLVAFDPVRPHAAFAPSEGDQIHVIEIETGTEVFSAVTPPDDDSFFPVYYDLGYSDDGRFLSVLNTSLLYVLDAATGERIRTRANPVSGDGYAGINWLTSLDYDADAGEVLVSDWSANLYVYGLEGQSGVVAHALDINDGIGYRLERFETIPGTRRIVLLGFGGLYTYDLDTRVLTPLSDQDEKVNGFALNTDGTKVAVGAGAIWYLYDLETDQRITEFETDFIATSNRDLIYSFAFSPDGDRVAALQIDGQLKI